MAKEQEEAFSKVKLSLYGPLYTFTSNYYIYLGFIFSLS